MKNNRYIREMSTFVGMFIMGAIVLAAITAGIYGVMGSASYNGLRWLSTGLVFLVLIAFYAGFRFGREHVRGVVHGLDIKIDARAKAAPKPATIVSPPATAAQRFDNLIPRQAGASIVIRQDDNHNPIEM